LVIVRFKALGNNANKMIRRRHSRYPPNRKYARCSPQIPQTDMFLSAGIGRSYLAARSSLLAAELVPNAYRM